MTDIRGSGQTGTNFQKTIGMSPVDAASIRRSMEASNTNNLKNSKQSMMTSITGNRDPQRLMAPEDFGRANPTVGFLSQYPTQVPRRSLENHPALSPAKRSVMTGISQDSRATRDPVSIGVGASTRRISTPTVTDFGSSKGPSSRGPTTNTPTLLMPDSMLRRNEPSSLGAPATTIANYPRSLGRTTMAQSTAIGPTSRYLSSLDTRTADSSSQTQTEDVDVDPPKSNASIRSSAKRVAPRTVTIVDPKEEDKKEEGKNDANNEEDTKKNSTGSTDKSKKEEKEKKEAAGKAKDKKEKPKKELVSKDTLLKSSRAGKSIFFGDKADVKFVSDYIRHHIDKLREDKVKEIPTAFFGRLIEDLMNKRVWDDDCRTDLFLPEEETSIVEETTTTPDSSLRFSTLVPAATTIGTSVTDDVRSVQSVTTSFIGTSDSAATGSNINMEKGPRESKSSEWGRKNRLFGLGPQSTRALKQQLMSRLSDKTFEPDTKADAIGSLNGAFNLAFFPRDFRIEWVFSNPHEYKKRLINIRWPLALFRAVYNLQAVICQNGLNPLEWINTPIRALTSPYRFRDIEGIEQQQTLSNLFMAIFSSIPQNYDFYWLDTKVSVITISANNMGLVAGVPWIQYTFETFRLRKYTQHCDSSFYEHMTEKGELRSTAEVIFNILQAIAIFESDLGPELSETAKDYQTTSVPLMPAAFHVEANVEVAYLRSSNQTTREMATLHIKSQGRSTNIAPWGIRVKVSTGEVAEYSAEELNLPTDTLNLDMWNQITAGGKVTITILPEHGSAARRFGNSIVASVWKPLHHYPIDFQNPQLSSSIVFAESNGLCAGIQYRYVHPIQVLARPGHVIMVTNLSMHRTYNTHTQHIANLDVWLRENAESTLDGGVGNLCYFSGGAISSDGQCVIDATYFDHLQCKYAVEEMPVSEHLNRIKADYVYDEGPISVRSNSISSRRHDKEDGLFERRLSQRSQLEPEPYFDDDEIYNFKEFEPADARLHDGRSNLYTRSADPVSRGAPRDHQDFGRSPYDQRPRGSKASLTSMMEMRNSQQPLQEYGGKREYEERRPAEPAYMQQQQLNLHQQQNRDAVGEQAEKHKSAKRPPMSAKEQKVHNKVTREMSGEQRDTYEKRLRRLSEKRDRLIYYKYIRAKQKRKEKKLLDGLRPQPQPQPENVRDDIRDPFPGRQLEPRKEDAHFSPPSTNTQQKPEREGRITDNSLGKSNWDSLQDQQSKVDYSETDRSVHNEHDRLQLPQPVQQVNLSDPRPNQKHDHEGMIEGMHGNISPCITDAEWEISTWGIRANHYTPKTKIKPVALLDLNGAYEFRQGQTVKFAIDELIYTTEGGDRLINIRWPRQLVLAVSDLHQCIAQNNISANDWIFRPVRELKNMLYTFRDAMDEVRRTDLYDLMDNIFNSVTSDYVLFWLDTTVTAYFLQTNCHFAHDNIPMIQRAFETFRQQKLNRFANSSFFAQLPGLSESVDVIFNVLQVVSMLSQPGNCVDEFLSQYGRPSAVHEPPRMPEVFFLDMNLESKDRYQSHVSIHLTAQGSMAHRIAPWGVRMTDVEGGTSKHVTWSMLGSPQKLVTELPRHLWEQMACGKITFSLIPEQSSPAYRFNDTISLTTFKPIHSTINFANLGFYEDVVVFAESFGDYRGIHYVYAPPVSAVARPGYNLVIMNQTLQRYYATGEESISDIDMWLYEHAPSDRGHGWGDLFYRYRGRMCPETGNLIDHGMFTQYACKFAVAQFPKDRYPVLGVQKLS